MTVLVRFFLFGLLPALLGAAAACGRETQTPSGPRENTVFTPESAMKPAEPETPMGTTARLEPETPGTPTTPTASPMGTAIPACDRYIQHVCSCARKHPAADLKQACDLATQSLPEWQSAHRDEAEELAVTKACHRAFLYIQASGRCEDAEP